MINTMINKLKRFYYEATTTKGKLDNIVRVYKADSLRIRLSHVGGTYVFDYGVYNKDGILQDAGTFTKNNLTSYIITLDYAISLCDVVKVPHAAVLTGTKELLVK